MTLLDIAKKHTSKDTQSSEVKSMYSILKKQIEKGIKVEMEHTKNKEVAKRIAMDHLA